MRVSVVVVCLILTAAAAQAAEKPWLVPLEERIAARTNASMARERVRLARPSTASPALRQQGAEQQHAVIVDDLSGRTNPELFLPHEVFRKLIHLAYTTPPRFSQVFREDHAKHLKQFPPDFWDQLRGVSSPYIAELWREEDIGRERRRATKEERAELGRNLCQSLAAALAESRHVFGRERFDQFLYESIAPHMFRVTDTLPTPEELMRLERGCP
jgi:hypothetical protein